MKSNLFLLLGLFYCIQTAAQKPALDSSTFGKWPRLTNIQISNDGRYSLYTAIDPLHGTHTLVVRSNRSAWIKTVQSTSFSKATFTTNSRLAYFLNGHDSLGCIALGQPIVIYTSHIRSFSISGDPAHEWLAYLDTAGALTLRDLSGRPPIAFPSVSYYAFTPNTRHLLLSTRAHDSLLWVDLATGQSVTLHNGLRAEHFTFDATGQNLAYTVADTLFYFQSNTRRAKPLIVHIPKGLDSGSFDPAGGLAFNESGDRILINLKKSPTPVRMPGAATVDIWNYKDKYLQTEMRGEYYSNNIDFQEQALVNVQTGEAFLANPGYARLMNAQHFDHYLLSVLHPLSDRGYYDPADRAELVLVSTIDGHKLPITRLSSYQLPLLSPDDKFLLWYDSDSLQFFSYDIDADITRNISQSVPCPLYDEDAAAIGRRSAMFEVPAWDTVHHAVYLYDKYDLWKISLDQSVPPVNLTNGYGRKEHLVFGLAVELEATGFSTTPILSSDGPLVLSGFDPHTKNNGFWELNTQHHMDPMPYNMDPYCYYIARTGAIGNIAYAHGNVFLKAKHAASYLVQKMDASEYPNIYFTENFRTYRPLSDLHPERAYNWLRASLITWTMTDGRTSQGILYLPANFDSTKKYPLIMNYYEKNSDELHQYKVPNFTGDLINVPYYVSNGYIMFMPDIYYKPGHNGEGVLNAVLSAAHYLASFPWIDSTKIGIQGHSFAGWETNYLITHSHIFAAAGEGAGVSDLISSYDELSVLGFSRQSFYETGSQGSPYGIGVTPWTRPDIYINTSPIFSVGKVTTPLLMMHGDADPAVPFSQAIEMYLAMQRAGKKVWLLQYEHASHGLSNENAVDYTLRLKQYFDYYLKGSLPPRWMTQGVPADQKGIDSGLQFDRSGALP
jgi:fermentation-respiration switch protein FrsA (DUF1100 family)